MPSHKEGLCLPLPWYCEMHQPRRLLVVPQRFCMANGNQPLNNFTLSCDVTCNFRNCAPGANLTSYHSELTRQVCSAVAVPRNHLITFYILQQTSPANLLIAEHSTEQRTTSHTLPPERNCLHVRVEREARTRERDNTLSADITIWRPSFARLCLRKNLSNQSRRSHPLPTTRMTRTRSMPLQPAA